MPTAADSGVRSEELAVRSQVISTTNKDVRRTLAFSTAAVLLGEQCLHQIGRPQGLRAGEQLPGKKTSL